MTRRLQKGALAGPARPALGKAVSRRLSKYRPPRRQQTRILAQAVGDHLAYELVLLAAQLARRA
ncbi:MAG: hypothetical protein QOI48_775 [Solirubrobacteraceae bacterium]|jgi:hypothetical protein|nr:hypothetical protein [Solirubrobacteraceae bacterium]